MVRTMPCASATFEMERRSSSWYALAMKSKGSHVSSAIAGSSERVAEMTRWRVREKLAGVRVC